MKDRKTRAVSLLAAAALCVSMLLPALAADNRAPVVWSDKIGGGTARIVTIPMGDGRTGEISLANNSMVEAVSAKTLIDQKNNQADTHVVAAINGGFFNSYTSGTPSFPGKCPLIMDAVVVDGKLIHTGRTAILGFTPEGTAMVDWVTLKGQVKLGNGFTPTAWSVNTLETDPTAVMLFDEHLTLPVTIPSSATMFRIQNGVITKAEPGGVLQVAKGEDVLVYNAKLAETERGYGRIPEVGMSAEVTFIASGTSRDTAWAGVKTALTGGPVLVKDGKNVVSNDNNAGFYGDPKQKPDAVLARSFVGITQSGGLVLGTVTASFNQIADWMVKNNLKEGIAMDGGASCMLYADGSGFVTQAGRNLASALVIVDHGSGQPSGGTPTTPAADIPDSWAAQDVQAAVAAGLVPESLQNGYKANITREDFCLLIWALIQKQPGYAQAVDAKPLVSFTDTSRDELLYVARLGIIEGNPDKTFKPDNLLRRDQAAKILAQTAKFLGVQDTGAQYPFPDRDFFGWATQFIDFCGTHEILKGVEGGVFNPGGNFTRQQAIVTILRIYQNYSAK